MANNYEQLLKLILDSLHYATLVDENANIIYMSKDYLALLDYTLEEVQGKNIKEIVPDTHIPSILESEPQSLGDYYFLKQDFPVFANRFPLIASDGVKGVFASAVVYSLDDISQLNTKANLLKQTTSPPKKEYKKSSKKEFALRNVIGNSKATTEINTLIHKFSASSLNIILTGETGVGKEIYANAIHALSDRSENPFVKINCAAIPKDLLESELFGYEEGAFSGAMKNGKLGKFEYANHGTILLDEVSEMPLTLQSKLLRVIQEKEVERIGGLTPIPIDVRILCCTNQNLWNLVKLGRFRQDLYYRINTVEIDIPPLRERVEDIAPLCYHFIEKNNQIHGTFISGIHESVLQFFLEYQWEGNVRELEHVLERACVSKGIGQLQLCDFSFLLHRILNFTDDICLSENKIQGLAEKKASAERTEIMKSLVLTNGNKSEAAKLLQIDRTLLYSKMKKYGLYL